MPMGGQGEKLGLLSETVEEAGKGVLRHESGRARQSGCGLGKELGQFVRYAFRQYFCL